MKDNKENGNLNKEENNINPNNDILNNEKSETVFEGIETNKENLSIDKNAVFFEKFEKSKKDFLKEKRKEKIDAKRSISSKNKGMGLSARLKDDSYTKKIWFIFISLSIILLAYSSTIMGFLGDKFYGATDAKWIFANYYSGLTQTSVIFSGITIVLIPLPYFYLFSTWFIGINNIHHSKYFVSTNFYIIVVSTILMLIVIPLSTIVFYFTSNFLPIA